MHVTRPLYSGHSSIQSLKIFQWSDKVSSNLPYLSTPGSIKTTLERIRHAATPPRVTNDFVESVLMIKGGNGRTIAPFLKRIGFAASDGTPTDLYKAFRNEATAGKAVAMAIKHGYKDLSQSNEYFYRLSDKELLALIIQVTGVESDNRAAALTLSSIKFLKQFADFDALETGSDVDEPPSPVITEGRPNQSMQVANQSLNNEIGLNLSYTINLNLPATSDQAVFNAIFRSLREHLLVSNG